MKKIHFLVSIFIMFFINYSYAQEHIVVDLATKEPIPYAAIKYVYDQNGFYSNDKGCFALKGNDKDTIQISCIGYKTVFKLIEKLADTIFLEPDVVLLKEVIVNNRKETLKNLGYAKKNKKLRWHLNTLFELGIFIKLQQEIPNNYIKSIQIPIGKSFIKEENKKLVTVKPNFNSAFRVNIYGHNNELNNQIGTSLLKKPIIVYCNEKSDNIINIDISDENIELTKNGVFISIEMIGEIDKRGNIINKKNLLPSFKFTNKSSKDFVSVQYYKSVFTEGWKQMEFEKYHLDKRYNLAIGITLAIYEP
jgi:hypothetical protein